MKKFSHSKKHSSSSSKEEKEKRYVSDEDEEIDEESESGKKKSVIFELNEIAYTKLILLLDVKTSSGKVAFNIIKGCKSKNYSDGNAAIAWERLK